jgi:hypothetical protein
MPLSTHLGLVFNDQIHTPHAFRADIGHLSPDEIRMYPPRGKRSGESREVSPDTARMWIGVHQSIRIVGSLHRYDLGS